MKSESVSLEFREGSSDKVYHASLYEKGKGWMVDFSYGRRGSSLTSGTKTSHPVAYLLAKSTYDKLVREKTGKGYKPQGGASISSIIPAGGEDTGFRPQLLNEIEEWEVEGYIKNPEFCAQEKFDGRNRGLLVDKSMVKGANRKGLEVAIPTTIAAELKTLDECVIAGEDLGNKVMCFDLISMKDKFISRDQALKELLKGKQDLIAVDTAWTETTKRNLYERLKRENAEGIVFKHKDAYYTPGRPASGGAQLKFKFVATCSVIAGEIKKGKRSVEMWIYDEIGKCISIGNVTVYPNQELPKKEDILEVKYLYAYKGGSLFQPVLLGVRDDLDLKDCTIDQLKYKKEE